MATGRLQVPTDQGDIPKGSAHVARLGIDRQSSSKLIFGGREVPGGIFEKAGIAIHGRIKWIELLGSGDGFAPLVEPADSCREIGVGGQDLGVAVTEHIAALIRRSGALRIELSVEQDETQSRVALG